LSIDEWSHPDNILESDAFLGGCGGWFLDRREYFHVVFPSHVLNQNININQLELLVVMVCVTLWNTHLFKKQILIKCDNQSVVMVLNSGSTRDLFMQTCLREILFFAAKFHFEIRAIHFPGVENRVADLLSRWHMNCSYKEEFFNLPNISVSSCNEKFVYSGLFQFIHDW
jgi:hypothetical protein